MKFGWKVLIPASIAWIMIVATLRVLSAEGARQIVIGGFTASMVLLVLAGTSIYERSKVRAEARAHEVPEMPEPTFPLPVMPSGRTSAAGILPTRSGEGGDGDE